LTINKLSIDIKNYTLAAEQYQPIIKLSHLIVLVSNCEIGVANFIRQFKKLILGISARLKS